MSADGWETVTDLGSIREGEPLRVLGQEGWEGRRPDDGGSPWLRSSGPMITSRWMIGALVERGQVERRAEPEPHPDDVALVARCLWNLSSGFDYQTARDLVRARDRQRRERGES